MADVLSYFGGMMAGMLSGRIIAESLRPGAELAVPELRLTRINRVDVADSVMAGQPAVWTLVDVSAPLERAGELASALAAALDVPGWYADFRAGDEHVVVFRGRILRYQVDDAAGRAAAQEYGRSVGVPEHQLDWPT